MSYDQKVRVFDVGEFKFVPGVTGILGQGSFGHVRLAFHKVHRWVAVKVLENKNNLSRSSLTKRLHDEVIPVQEANNPNVVRVFGEIHTPVGMGIAMEYMPGNCLSKLVLDSSIEFKPALWLRFCRDIANGVSGIHNLRLDKRLAHGDLKLDNVLVSLDLDCKIGDFGSSELAWHTCLGDDSDRCERNAFTPIYAAPERLTNSHMKLTTAMDVFSVGMIFYYMLERDYGDSDRIVQLLQTQRRPLLYNFQRLQQEHANVSLNYGAINAINAGMESCWKEDPLERPNIINVRDMLQSALDQFTETHLLDCVKSTIETYPIAYPRCSTWVSFHQLDLPKENMYTADDNATLLPSINISTDDNVASQELLPCSNRAQHVETEDYTPPKVVACQSSFEQQNFPPIEPNSAEDNTTPKAAVGGYSRYGVLLPLRAGQATERDCTSPKLIRHESAKNAMKNGGCEDSLGSAEVVVLMALNLTCCGNGTLSKERKVWHEVCKFLTLATNTVQNNKTTESQVKQHIENILSQLHDQQNFDAVIKDLTVAKLKCFLADCFLFWKDYQMAIETATEAMSVLVSLGKMHNTIALAPCCYHIIAKALKAQGCCEAAGEIASIARSMLMRCNDLATPMQRQKCIESLEELSNVF